MGPAGHLQSNMHESGATKAHDDYKADPTKQAPKNFKGEHRSYSFVAWVPLIACSTCF